MCNQPIRMGLVSIYSVALHICPLLHGQMRVAKVGSAYKLLDIIGFECECGDLLMSHLNLHSPFKVK